MPFRPGTPVVEVFGDLGTGPIRVRGENPALGAQNAALIFDSENRSGGDNDLGTPHEDFGGPGIGDGGAMGSPFENARALGHVLVVAEDLDDGDGDGLVDDPDDTNHPDAELAFDFEEVGTVKIVSLTIIDFDQNPGAEVELQSSDGTILAVVPLPTTGDNGVAVVDLGDVEGVARMFVRMGGSGAIDELAFKKECTGSIGDLVWHDLDRDGIQDAGEPGIEGIALTLLDMVGTTLMRTESGEGGAYEFAGVCAGEYVVQIDESTLPEGLVPSPCNVGDDDAVDNDCSPARVVLLEDDSMDPTIDFGFNTPCTGSIGDLVWHDLNRNGLQDPDEPGIPGVGLTLRTSEGDEIARTTSGREGGYEFNGLCAGAYVVEVVDETLPDGFVPSDCDVGDDDTIDNDCSGVTVVLPADDSSDPTIDFGFQSECTGAIGDLVWHDLDRDGLQDEGEPGLQGIMLMLQGEGGEPLARAVTDRSGEYAFNGLCAGAYVVLVVEDSLPPGFEPAPCNVGDDDTIDNDCSPARVVLETDGSRDDSIDFGFVSACEGSIGDLVWHDLNRNGLQDADEPGLEEIEVVLKDERGVTLCMQTTDAEGGYTFTGLCAGTYRVEVNERTLPPGFTAAPCNVGDDDTIDNDCSPVRVVLEGDMDADPTIDFGYVAECQGSIGDFVWLDENGNGLQDEGEPGIEGVRLRLKGSMGEVLCTETTDAGGFYEFGGLCAGKYVVEVDPSTLRDDLTPTDCNVGDDDTIDNDCSPACVELATDDEKNPDVDFGYRRPFEGCTPGYWKQPHHFDSWPDGYHPDMLFAEVFEDAFPDKTLVEVLAEGGGMLDALGRHTVAALLNGASAGVNYPLSDGEVIEMFNDVFEGSDQAYEELKNLFEDYNESGCPLN